MLYTYRWRPVQNLIDLNLVWNTYVCGPWLKKQQNQRKCVFHDSHQGCQWVQLTIFHFHFFHFSFSLIIFHGSHQGFQRVQLSQPSEEPPAQTVGYILIKPEVAAIAMQNKQFWGDCSSLVCFCSHSWYKSAPPAPVLFVANQRTFSVLYRLKCQVFLLLTLP